MHIKRKYFSILSTIIGTSLLLSACGSTPTNSSTSAPGTTTPASATKKSDGPKLNFRLAETHPADYPTTIGDKKFAELVNQASDGRIKIDVFPASQLGEEKAVIEQVQL
jgi:TRAP-type C4-dicarboxylate transport system substrate-binding protein